MSNNGKELEIIVAMIEKSINPSAKISIRKHLPVLNSQSNCTRECDIVIEEGEFPRKFVTIVEVQDRNYQVSIGHFDSWVAKLNDVGANRLVCVSRKKFPKSIIEKAEFRGNQVCLVEIPEYPSTEDELPIHIFNIYRMDFCDFEMKIIKVNIICPEKANTDFNYNTNDQIWSLDSKTTTSLFMLIQERHMYSDGEGECIVEFGKDSPFYLKFDNDFLSVRLQCKYRWTCKQLKILPSVMSYRQEGQSIAWVLDFRHQIKNGGSRTIIPLIKDKKGDYICKDFYSRDYGNVGGLTVIGVTCE